MHLLSQFCEIVRNFRRKTDIPRKISDILLFFIIAYPSDIRKRNQEKATIPDRILIFLLPDSLRIWYSKYYDM